MLDEDKDLLNLASGVQSLSLVNDGDELPALLRSRAAFAGNVTKCMNKLNEDLESNKAAQIIEEDIEPTGIVIVA